MGGIILRLRTHNSMRKTLEILGEYNGEVPLDEGGEESHLPLLLALLSLLPTLFSESLLDLLISCSALARGRASQSTLQTLAFGMEALRRGWSTPGLLVGDAMRKTVLMMKTRSGVRTTMLSSDACCCWWCGVGAEVLGFTPFSSRCSGHGF